MISAIATLIFKKLVEFAQTPGITAKAQALVLGRHSTSSIVGILSGLIIIAGAAVAEKLGTSVDWPTIFQIAAGIAFAGRVARPRRKISAAPTEVTKENDGQQGKTSPAVAGGGEPEQKPEGTNP